MISKWTTGLPILVPSLLGTFARVGLQAVQQLGLLGLELGLGDDPARAQFLGLLGLLEGGQLPTTGHSVGIASLGRLDLPVDDVLHVLGVGDVVEGLLAPLPARLDEQVPRPD